MSSTSPAANTTPSGPTSHDDRSDLTDLAVDLRLACMRISRRIRTEGAGDLPPHQFSVLAKLSEATRTSAELAEAEKVSAPTMHKTVAGLVERGYIRRTEDPHDARCVNLALTTTGARALAAAKRERNEWMHIRLEGLTAAERDALAAAVTALSKVANQ